MWLRLWIKYRGMRQVNVVYFILLDKLRSNKFQSTRLLCTRPIFRVNFHSLWTPKPLTALQAGVRFLLCVAQHVLLQQLPGRVLFLADAALVRLLSRMKHPVVLQGRHMAESFPANVAFQRLHLGVFHDVHSKLSVSCKTGATNGAFVRP